MKNRNIAVLISTYNGEKYLEALLDSVLNSKKVDFDIIVRDDGSKDKTHLILEDYSKKYKNIKVYYGKNLGYAKSFWELIKLAGDYEYYAFCDQDDIWLENKLFKAIEKIEEIENKISVLYTSRVVSVDNNMNVLSENTFPNDKALNVYESFQKSVVPGCTFVFNKESAEILKQFDGNMESHDWAAYTIISVFGKVIYDNNSYIKYRIHDSNAIGQDSRLGQLKIKVSRFFQKRKNTRSKFAQAFYASYKNKIPEKYKNDIAYLAFYRESFKYKIKLLFSNKFKGIIFKIYVILNRV